MPVFAQALAATHPRPMLMTGGGGESVSASSAGGRLFRKHRNRILCLSDKVLQKDAGPSSFAKVQRVRFDSCRLHHGTSLVFEGAGDGFHSSTKELNHYRHLQDHRAEAGEGKCEDARHHQTVA